MQLDSFIAPKSIHQEFANQQNHIISFQPIRFLISINRSYWHFKSSRSIRIIKTYNMITICNISWGNETISSINSSKKVPYAFLASVQHQRLQR